jgi:Putative adhesin
MKRYSTLISMPALAFAALAITSIATAQEKVTVPLSSPGQPATLKVHMVTGSITVTTGSAGQMVVDTEAGGGDVTGRGDAISSAVRAQVESALGRSGRREEPIPPGMHRIDANSFGFRAEEDHNVVTVIPDVSRQSRNLVIQVPPNTSVQLKTVNGGHIDVTGVNGDIDVENTNGSITLKNVSGSMSAHTLNGAITASIDKVTPDKPLSFSSLNGKVDVTLPADTKARLRLKTTNGAVYSDFDVKMETDSKPVVEDGRGQGGKYRIRMDRGVYGSINGGGPEYTFQTMNGTILIHKK